LGEEIIFALNNNYCGKLLNINQGHRLSLQYHKKKDETLYLAKRQDQAYQRQKPTRIEDQGTTRGSSFHLPPGTIHRMEALIKSQLIEVSTPQLTDVVRLEDDYERISKIKTAPHLNPLPRGERAGRG